MADWAASAQTRRWRWSEPAHCWPGAPLRWSEADRSAGGATCWRRSAAEDCRGQAGTGDPPSRAVSEGVSSDQRRAQRPSGREDRRVAAAAGTRAASERRHSAGRAPSPTDSDPDLLGTEPERSWRPSRGPRRSSRTKRPPRILGTK